MRIETIFARSFIALALVFAVQTTASAQLGNLLNKAKNAVQEKVTDVKQEVKQEVKEEVEEKVEQAPQQDRSKTALGEAPARPWVLDENEPADQVDRLIQTLGGMNSDKTKAFGEQISARAEYDAKLLAGMKDGSIPKDEDLKKAAEKELELADAFYAKVVKNSTVYGAENMQKRADGTWYHQGPVKLSFPGKGETYYVTVQNNDAVFCTKDDFDGKLVGDAAIEAARQAFTASLNMGWLLEGYAKGKSEANEKAYYRSTFVANTIGSAIANNKKEVVDRVNKFRADIKNRYSGSNQGSSSTTSKSSGSSSSSSSGRAAKRIQGSNSNVTAYVGSTVVGTAKVSGSNINVYTKGSSGTTGVIHGLSGNHGSIDFRGTSNRFSIDKVGETIVFRSANGGTLGSVRHNKAMRKYEVVKEGTSSSIAEFDDSLDPRFAALFFYKFFD